MTELTGAWKRTAAGAGLLGPDGSVSPTIFAEMTALATSTGAINLGQGFPDEDGPAEVLDAARAQYRFLPPMKHDINMDSTAQFQADFMASKDR